MKSRIQSLIPSLAFLLLLLASLRAHAISPPPDGGYPGGNTAEGQNALLSNSTGGFNTAIGFDSLRTNATGQFNTAIGAGTLLANTADGNTATGTGALLSNTTGIVNTANGEFTLLSNTTGNANTGVGEAALFSNTTGNDNTALGNNALQNNIGGNNNTANGAAVLFSNTTGSGNAAMGQDALTNNTAGSNNTAIGVEAGSNQTTGSSNVYIGAGMSGLAGENGACYIGSIFGQTSANGVPVLINSNNQLGTVTSSKRFKENIKSMDKASEVLFSLKPVSFRYKNEIDPAGTAQLGLVAEDVEKISPALVVHDKQGKPYSVRYDQVNAMLLNEFLKEHRKVEKLEATVGDLAAELQKVSAQLQTNKPSAQVVVNNH